jgi:hypothetical protein
MFAILGTLWTILTFAAGVVMFAARTGPSEAGSKLSEWATFLRFRNLPWWLRDRKADQIASRYALYALIFLLIVGVVAAAILFNAASIFSATVVQDDLRVSFEANFIGKDKIEVKYIFLNLGKQSNLIYSAQLFEISSIEEKAEKAENNFDLCDSVDSKLLRVVEGVNSIMKFMSIQGTVGQIKTNNYVYNPTKISVDGVEWKLNEPISVESGKTKIVSVEFAIDPHHSEKSGIVAFCPIVATQDTSGIVSSSLCRGVARTILSPSFTSVSRSLERFRILPHPNDVSCPVVNH